MNHIPPSPVERAQMIAEAGRIIAEAAIREAGGAAQLVCLPLSAATQMTGLSRKTISRKMEVITDGSKQTVTLKALLEYQAKHTKSPVLK